MPPRAPDCRRRWRLNLSCCRVSAGPRSTRNRPPRITRTGDSRPRSPSTIFGTSIGPGPDEPVTNGGPVIRLALKQTLLFAVVLPVILCLPAGLRGQTEVSLQGGVSLATLGGSDRERWTLARASGWEPRPSSRLLPAWTSNSVPPTRRRARPSRDSASKSTWSSATWRCHSS